MRFLNKIWTITLLLFSLSACIAFVYSPELSKLYGYDNSYIFFYKQLISLAIGVIIIFGLSKLNYKDWFNKVGAITLIISALFMLLMQIVPPSGVATIQGVKTYLVFDGFAVSPMLFLFIGLIWLVSYVYSKKKNFKVIAVSVLVFVGGIIIYLLTSPHRIERIKTWLNTLSVTQTPQNALHETLLLSIVDTIGIFGLVVTVGVFVGLFYILIQKEYSAEIQKYFVIGVSFLIGFVLFVNILYSFGLSPLAPTLYFIGYGTSAILSTSLMIGMLLMQDTKKI
ncbi:FtsW/RodA/SpoVE family cell cycle protein [Sulfurimonas sp. NWX79]|uniref:FtsW/RodA/SpoVE family cell cycle protein n=1 Tax=Sulfurimonas sp. NWX79 TaxID=2925412 RepID=UPI003204801D